MRLYRALSTALCVVLASTWSYSQEHAFPGTGLSKVVENNDINTVRPGDISSELQLPNSFSFGGIDEQTSGTIRAAYTSQVSQPPSVPPTPESPPPESPTPESAVASTGSETTDDAERFRGNFSNDARRYDVGTDFYSPPEFEGGLIVFGKDVAMKIGGYVKADFIYDFDPIDSTDLFNTTTIPVGAPTGQTLVFMHGRQG